MSACYCLCEVHANFASVRCARQREVSLHLHGHDISMCKACALWWEESQIDRPIEPRGRQARFDPAALYRAITMEMRARGGLSQREVARQVKLSPSSLLRIKQGDTPNTDTLVKLLRWMGRTDLDSFTTYREQR